MNSDVVISIQNVSKAYRMWETPSARLTVPMMESAARVLPGGQALRKRAASRYRDFWALKDISFELKQGEAIGIIGRNGSGKSTLLQIIAGTLQPTGGEVKVTGRVAALLELGSGFNPDFTGRENVHLSAAVLGLSRAEIDARFEEIVAFADIGDFIDQPVKTYSSGMMVRLAFAVNTCVDPDILMVDEALSVGDAPFQAKCFRRLRQLIDKGVSLLFVSHDIGTVRSICSRALWLKGGRAEMWGEAKAVAKEYEKFCWQEAGVKMERSEPEATVARITSAVSAIPTTPAKSPGSLPTDRMVEMLRTLPNETLAKCTNRYGTTRLMIRNFVLVDELGNPLKNLQYGQVARAHYLVHSKEAFSAKLRIGLRVKNLKGDFLLAASDLTASPRVDLPANGEAVFSLDFPAHLAHGEYAIHSALFEVKNLVASEPEAYEYADSIVHDCVEETWFFTVQPHRPIAAAGPVHHHTRLVVQVL